MKPTPQLSRRLLAAGTFLISTFAAFAQGVPTTTAPSAPADTADENVLQLSPFEVSARDEQGYSAATTLAGNRLNTELRDIGNAVTVVTSQFLADVGATNNQTLLQYTVSSEVGTIQGNFTGVGDAANPTETGRFPNPSTNTRVRGLAAADNTRDYFLTDIPWDSYNVDRVDLQRGPNSILFGQGSPAGIINTGTKQATFKNAGEASIRFDDEGSVRATLDLNQVLIPDELALRVIGLRDRTEFQQEPAYQKDERLFGALRWEPRFLRRGSARTILRASGETGHINSNQPRAMPPYDYITPWFRTGTYQGYMRDAAGNYVPSRTFNQLNRETFDPFQLQDAAGLFPNRGQTRSALVTGEANPAYQPWLGNFGQNYEGPLAYFDGNATLPMLYRSPEPRTVRGIGPNGAIDANIGGIPFNRQGAIAPYPTFARNAGLPYAEFGIYKGLSLTDPSIFDFYNNLIDGPNKEEWQNFDTYDVNLAQTFLDDRFGFEAAYHREKYDNGQTSLLSDTRNGIFVDLMGTYSNGQPNPNVGRPFITDSGQFGNNTTAVDREASRLTAFLTHDFTRQGGQNWATRLLGRHTLTGLWAHDENERDSRNFQRWAVLDPSFIAFQELPASTRFSDNPLAVSNVIYLGPALTNATTATGANIPRPTQMQIPRSGTIQIFNSTWNATGVDPAAPWFNAATGTASTESENPANYVGWTTRPVEITNAIDSRENLDRLTTSARLTRSRVSSEAFVWQAHFWDNSLVGTFGYREDTAKSWTTEQLVNNQPTGLGFLPLGESYKLDDEPDTRLHVVSRSYSLVAHLNDLPFVGRYTERLPVIVSLSYNKSENFQPAANRVDIYGDPIAAPAGDTIDRGILIETKDNRFSLRVTKYRTRVVNSTSSAIEGDWFIGTSQAWAGNWANIFEYNLGGDTIETANQGDPGRYTYAPMQGETPEQAAAREAAAVSAWRAWQQQVDPRLYTAWGINLNDLSRSITASAPAGLAVTEDATSEGWEYEFNAQPTRNWRLTLNAADTKAVRENVGGEALSNFVAAYDQALRNTAAGDLRIWWGSSNETALTQWNANFRSNYALRSLQEGTNVPELRRWRVNLISNYDFTTGALRGFSAGGGVRWQDKIVIGYPPTAGATLNDISFDLANPYYGPQETNVDLWVGYGRKLSDRVNWRIQLNVRNVAMHDDLIPIAVQPDGSPGYYRIAPTEVWTLTNTFSF